MQDEKETEIMQGYVGFTDAEFMCIGQLRKGSPKQQGRMGRDLQHFRPAFFEGEEESAARFRKEYGDTPTEIPITFPFDEPARVWSYGLEAYTGAGVRVMLVDADTNAIQYHFDPRTGESLVKNGLDAKTGEPAFWDGESPAYTYTSKKTGEFKEVLPKLNLRLRVMVPHLQRVVYMLVVSRSWNDKKNISGQLAAFYAMRGSLKGLPLILRRRPQEVLTSRPDGRKFRDVKWLISIESSQEFAIALFAEMHAAAMPDGGVSISAPQLPPEGSEETDAEGSGVSFTSEDHPLLDINGLSLRDGTFHEAAISTLGYKDTAAIVQKLTLVLGQGWARFDLRELWKTLVEHSEQPPSFFGLNVEDGSFHQAAIKEYGFADADAIATFMEDNIGLDWTTKPVDQLWTALGKALEEKFGAVPPTGSSSVVPDFVAGLKLEDDSFYRKAKDIFGFEHEQRVVEFLEEELGEGWAARHTMEQLWAYIDAAYQESGNAGQVALPGLMDTEDIPF